MKKLQFLSNKKYNESLPEIYKLIDKYKILMEEQMKKFCLLTILLLFLFTTASSQVIDEPYDFPKPGTTEGEQLSPSERG